MPDTPDAGDLIWILGDQLSPSLQILRDADPKRDRVLMVEVQDEAIYVRHHKQKLVLVLSAMRHFADELRAKGFVVDYVSLSDSANTHSFESELQRAVDRLKPQRVRVTEPGEWRVKKIFERIGQSIEVAFEVLDDNRFLCSLAEFAAWAEGRKQLRMEFFYREMRRKTAWLMEGDEPLGGQWNYDRENRKALPVDIDLPDRLGFEPDAITREVMELVGERFGDHFGDMEPFRWGVTRGEADQALDDFIRVALPQFGDYQDAMTARSAFVFHSLIAVYLNLGLLDPRAVCEAVLGAFQRGDAPLAAVEGFIRQILGWREFVRGLYWLKMPDYAETNFLEAARPLPSFYWDAQTDLRCLRSVVEETRKHAYAHHIQRLMVTGNFALLAGIEPKAVEEWYLLVYADAYEWVELPNTHGMALHADGGLLGSKPYAASGAYIDRMSDYCKDCAYNPKKKLGEGACPFNYLYWDFLMRNETRLRKNPRMGMPYRNLDRMDAGRKKAIRKQANTFLDSVCGTD
ncbi:MAG: cryptochrome/photolyase family protein [Opitutales bacterium]|nr:cryptochrome/photolyase family protein [Opitutales bacterium]